MTRIRSLDALRGVAALAVVFTHLTVLHPSGLYFSDHPFEIFGGWLAPLRLVIAGPGAVLVFYVLSGLVLALTFTSNDHQDYRPFLIKRITRIWPPFAFAVLVSAVLQYYLGASTPNYDFDTWTVPVSWSVIAQHIGLIFAPLEELDHPMWSLVHEMRVSIIFPLIVWLTFRAPWRSVLAAIALVPFAYVSLSQRHGWLIASLSWTAAYLYLFVIGALIAHRFQDVRRFVASIPLVWRVLLWGFALIAIQYPNRKTPDQLWQIAPFLLAGLAAVVIVALCTTENAVTGLLEKRLPMWLGKVSYSLYLIHMPVLMAVFHAFPNAPYLQNAAITFILALISAELMYRFVERPSMAAGRRIARPSRSQGGAIAPRAGR